MIPVHEAEAIQKEVASLFGDPIGVLDREALVRALARPFATNQTGIPVYPTFFNRLSILFQGLIETKPFAGSNRRTALTILVYLLDARGYRFQTTQRDIDALLLGVEAGFTTWHRVTAWIKGHTVKVNPKRMGNK